MSAFVRRFIFFPVFEVSMLALALVPTRAPAQESAAPAGQVMCNETSYIIKQAIVIPQKKSALVKGWIRLRPGQCHTIIKAPLSKGRYYTYGFAAPVHSGGRREWGGMEPFCVTPKKDFAVRADAREKCHEPGWEERGFNLMNVKAPSGGKTVLSEPARFGSRAQMAGIQRLLRDNGYMIRAIDGYAGRRTRNAIRRFLRTKKINRQPENPVLIDLLEKTAAEKLKETGLHICNRAGGTVWAAYGRKVKKGWQSRGWWKLADDQCLRLISGPFRDKNIYIYAGLEQDGGERVLKDAKEPFCVSDVLFSITGHANCAARGFEKRAFALFHNTSGTGIHIDLTKDSFSQKSVISGLRR